MKKKLIYLIMLSSLGCHSAGLDKTIGSEDSLIISSKPDSSKFIVDKSISRREEKILDLIRNINEVKASDKYIDSFSHHKKGIATLIFKPTKGEKNYTVQAGYNGESSFETYYNFYVDSATLQIKIQDPVDGDVVTIDEWRRREEKRKQ